MTKLNYVVAVMLVAFVVLSPTHAQQVKKWTDKDGKVHYGDAMNAPAKSESVRVAANSNGYSTDVPKTSESSKKAAPDIKKKGGEIDAKFGLPVEAINQCIAYAKEYARVPRQEGKLGDSKATGLIAQISKSCPNVEISCTIKTQSPQDDRCEAIKPTSKNKVFSGTVDNIPRGYIYGQ
ncbi:DUF4124 domain-containing protein [Undibacterium flavidum]|uniref:DUF4124 domain-containing protein n=1 Tax=Undibacterium flavidum TaxID=2762297 RepID=A0ABR6YAU6_9BURK|nr:DUF4124 domain-containing protein [Undibacterium flavidum]MBC3873675.1 DUF4124 domain-containing protein [Undibacterium flavidum]